MPTVTIGGLPAMVLFSGLTPDPVGLYQINAEVPTNAPTASAVSVAVSIGGVPSNTVLMAVQSFRKSEGKDYSKRKVTSIIAETSTGWPFFSPGRKRHCLTASTAFSSRPRPSALTTLISRTVPSRCTTKFSTTVP